MLLKVNRIRFTRMILYIHTPETWFKCLKAGRLKLMLNCFGLRNQGVLRRSISQRWRFIVTVPSDGEEY